MQIVLSVSQGPSTAELSYWSFRAHQLPSGRPSSENPLFCPQGHFPEPEKDPVIQIASLVTVHGQTAPVVKNIMTLNTCASIIGAEVMDFETEEELLRRWRVSLHMWLSTRLRGQLCHGRLSATAWSLAASAK